MSRKSKPDNPEQVKRFLRTACEVAAKGGDQETFDRVLGK